MPTTCCVIGCGSRGNRDKFKFYKIPSELHFSHKPRLNELSKRRRRSWIEAIKRKDLTEIKLKNMSVCGKHFVTGKPAPLEHDYHPDWVPSQYMGHDGDVFPNGRRRKRKAVDKDVDIATLEDPLETVEDPLATVDDPLATVVENPSPTKKKKPLSAKKMKPLPTKKMKPRATTKVEKPLPTRRKRTRKEAAVVNDGIVTLESLGYCLGENNLLSERIILEVDGVEQQYQNHGEIGTFQISEEVPEMEADLLLKEDEFRKENEKVELRSKQLMVKVSDVMKIQDNLIKNTIKHRTELNEATRGNKYFKNPIADETLLSIDEGKNDETQGCAKSNPDKILRVFKGKFIAAEFEREKLQNELRQKNEEIKKLQKENQMLKEEKEKWFLSHNSSKNTIGKLESQLSNLNAKFQTKETENLSLKKELENLKNELKNANLNFNNCGIRFTRACEENEKLKAEIKQWKEEDKDLKEGYRKQINELTTTVKRLEKQKVEILNGFKKQTQLIDVLKKQKGHIEALKVCEMAEAEYLKILNWNFE